MYYHNRMAGLITLLVGVALFLIAVGPLLLRVCVALFALSLINRGLRMRGLPDIRYMFQLWTNAARF